MFLADGRADPRRDFLPRLRDWLPDAGSIVVYNAQFKLASRAKALILRDMRRRGPYA